MTPANSGLAISVVQRFDRDTTRQVLQQQLNATRKLIQPHPTTVIGAIDFQGWQQTEQIMLDHRQISKPVNVVMRLKPVME